jgi:hypothetical protein
MIRVIVPGGSDRGKSELRIPMCSNRCVICGFGIENHHLIFHLGQQTTIWVCQQNEAYAGRSTHSLKLTTNTTTQTTIMRIFVLIYVDNYSRQTTAKRDLS